MLGSAQKGEHMDEHTKVPHPDSGYFPGMSNGFAWCVLAAVILLLAVAGFVLWTLLT